MGSSYHTIERFYDKEGRNQAAELLADGARLQGRAVSTEEHWSKSVAVGIGEIVATGGGSDTVSVMRFLQSRIVVRVGDSVEFTNRDPITPHTVTFGTEPVNPFPPSGGVAPDVDGALKATLGSPGDSSHSGLLIAEAQDEIGAPQTPPGVTRFRVTFTAPGLFNYICALHDDLGMKGKVFVLP